MAERRWNRNILLFIFLAIGMETILTGANVTADSDDHSQKLKKNFTMPAKPPEPPTFIGSDSSVRSVTPENIYQQIDKCLPPFCNNLLSGIPVSSYMLNFFPFREIPYLPHHLSHFVPNVYPSPMAPYNFQALESCTQNPHLETLIRNSYTKIAEQENRKNKSNSTIVLYPNNLQFGYPFMYPNFGNFPIISPIPASIQALNPHSHDGVTSKKCGDDEVDDKEEENSSVEDVERPVRVDHCNVSSTQPCSDESKKNRKRSVILHLTTIFRNLISKFIHVNEISPDTAKKHFDKSDLADRMQRKKEIARVAFENYFKNRNKKKCVEDVEESEEAVERILDIQEKEEPWGRKSRRN